MADLYNATSMEILCANFTSDEGDEGDAGEGDGTKERKKKEPVAEESEILSFMDVLGNCELAPIDAYTELTFSYECKISKCAAIADQLNICQEDKSECDPEDANYNPDLAESLSKIGKRVKY